VLAFVFTSALLSTQCLDCHEGLYLWIISGSMPAVYDRSYVLVDRIASRCRHASIRWRSHHDYTPDEEEVDIESQVSTSTAPAVKKAAPCRHVSSISLSVASFFGIFELMSFLGYPVSVAPGLLLILMAVDIYRRRLFWCFKHLELLERNARQAERMRLRERLTSNVLTIAQIMEVQCTTAEQRVACAALRQQNVVRYDPEALGGESSCCLCMHNFNCMEEITRTLCGHVFHTECLATWLQTQTGQQTLPSCPLCRGQLAANLTMIPSAHSYPGMTQSGMSTAIHGRELVQIVGQPIENVSPRSY